MKAAGAAESKEKLKQLRSRRRTTTHRAKDAADLVFLGEYFKARGEELPSLS